MNDSSFTNSIDNTLLFIIFGGIGLYLLHLALFVCFILSIVFVLIGHVTKHPRLFRISAIVSGISLFAYLALSAIVFKDFVPF